MLSATVVLPDSKPVGTHPVVCKFLKGVFNKRPPLARYKEIWDVKPVLNYLRSLSPVRFISLKQLTLKLCGLIALVSAQRAQTLSLLSLTDMLDKKSKIVFVLSDLVKQSRPGNVGQKVVLLSYPPDRRLCVCTVMREYINRTKRLRGNEKALFISFREPHEKVSKDTISRWVRSMLTAAGIDTSIFKSHSTRAASSSAARAKFVPISDIIETAGWSSDRTFQKYYNKPIVKENGFANAVLNNV